MNHESGACRVELRVDDVFAAQVPFRVAAKLTTTDMRRMADRKFTSPAISRTSLMQFVEKRRPEFPATGEDRPFDVTRVARRALGTTTKS